MESGHDVVPSIWFGRQQTTHLGPQIAMGPATGQPAKQLPKCPSNPVAREATPARLAKVDTETLVAEKTIPGHIWHGGPEPPEKPGNIALYEHKSLALNTSYKHLCCYGRIWPCAC